MDRFCFGGSEDGFGLPVVGGVCFRECDEDGVRRSELLDGGRGGPPIWILEIGTAFGLTFLPKAGPLALYTDTEKSS